MKIKAICNIFEIIEETRTKQTNIQTNLPKLSNLNAAYCFIHLFRHYFSSSQFSFKYEWNSITSHQPFRFENEVFFRTNFFAININIYVM